LQSVALSPARGAAVLLRGCLVATLLLAFATGGYGQEPVIDPSLVRLMQPDVRASVAAYVVARPEQAAEPPPFGGSLSLDRGPAGRVRVAVFVELPTPGDTRPLDELRAAGAEVGGVIAGIAVVRIPLEALDALLRLRVTRVQAARTLRLVHDSSMIAIGAHTVRQRVDGEWTGTTGEGAIVGVIDTGLDITHPDFLDDDGVTRVAGLWDMMLQGTGPPGFSYGVYCTRTAIQTVVITGTTSSCPTSDFNGHGTHVAGTAAGSGAASPGFSLAGVAPRAELLIVRAGNGTFGEDRVIDGTLWIRREAQALGRPVVLNLSLGHQFGPHDGSLLFERMLDEISGPGFIVVASAGNEGVNLNTLEPVITPPRLVHARMQPAPGQTAAVQFVVTPYTPAANLCSGNFIDISVWYEVRDRVHITVIRPDGTQHSAAPGESSLSDDAQGRIEISNAVPLKAQGTAEVSIVISGCGPSGPPAQGTWTITARPDPVPGATGAPIDVYINTARLGSGGSVHGTVGFDNRFLVGSPAAAQRVIAVGAFVTRTCWPALDRTVCYTNPATVGDIAPFSVAGPTRDGRVKPEITAPGMGIMSAYSRQSTGPRERIAPGGDYWVLEGTSMAAPHVAGAIALMYEHRPGITPEDVLDIFSRSARQDIFTTRTYGNFPGAQPSDWWGFGKLDVPAALAELLGGGTVASLTIRPQVDTVPLGGTLPLFAEALDESGASLFANVFWESLDPGIATVGTHGVVRGLALGTARIVARADAQADTAIITVAPPAVLVVTTRSAAPERPFTGEDEALLPLMAITVEARGPEGVQLRQLAFEVTGADPAARLVLIADPEGDGKIGEAPRIVAARDVNFGPVPRTVTLPIDTFVVGRNTTRHLILAVELSGRAPTGSEFQATLIEGGTRSITVSSRVQDRVIFEGATASGPAVTTVLREGELFALSENPVRRDSVTFNFSARPTTAAIYTVTGSRVADLLPRFEGLTYRWDLTNDAGSRIVPGVYLMVFRVEGQLVRERLMVLSPRVEGQ
jgi:subtilisin family serine protease